MLPVTALSGESWREIRGMLASRYDIEFVVSSHDPEQRSMSYDTGIAEMLLVARRLRDGESTSGRGRFVNLWRTARLETDALALVRAVNAAATAPSLRSDGPPVGGTPLLIGGEQWGEIVDGPVQATPWTASRWKYAPNRTICRRSGAGGIVGRGWNPPSRKYTCGRYGRSLQCWAATPTNSWLAGRIRGLSRYKRTISVPSYLESVRYDQPGNAGRT